MSPTVETHSAYAKVYNAIRHPELRKRLHAIAHDPRVPAGIVRAWTLQRLRHRVGDRDGRGERVSYPTPPSASVPGASTVQALELIQRAERVVIEHVPDFRRGDLADLANDEPDAEPPPRAVAPSTPRDEWRNEG